jgi:hypothetical protein
VGKSAIFIFDYYNIVYSIQKNLPLKDFFEVCEFVESYQTIQTSEDTPQKETIADSILCLA